MHRFIEWTKDKPKYADVEKRAKLALNMLESAVIALQNDHDKNKILKYVSYIHPLFEGVPTAVAFH
jgi:hypothetical protein